MNRVKFKSVSPPPRAFGKNFPRALPFVMVKPEMVTPSEVAWRTVALCEVGRNLLLFNCKLRGFSLLNFSRRMSSVYWQQP